MKKDIMSVLPDGSEFVSWEMPCSYDTVIHVNPAHKMSADNNDGSSEACLLYTSISKGKCQYKCKWYVGLSYYNWSDCT